jgi:hypothetical protein
MTKVLWGILILPVIGIGLLLLLPGIHLLALSALHDRGRFFCDANGVAKPILSSIGTTMSQISLPQTCRSG